MLHNVEHEILILILSSWLSLSETRLFAFSAISNYATAADKEWLCKNGSC
jgi:hypothetical protein